MGPRDNALPQQIVSIPKLLSKLNVPESIFFVAGPIVLRPMGGPSFILLRKKGALRSRPSDLVSRGCESPWGPYPSVSLT